MRQAVGTGTKIATAVALAFLLFGLMLVPRVGASDDYRPSFQAATATATAGGATATATTGGTDATATTTTGGTGGAAATATTGGTTGGTDATATTEATGLPNTGADTNFGLLLLGGMALIVVGAATVLVLTNRRETQS